MNVHLSNIPALQLYSKLHVPCHQPCQHVSACNAIFILKGRKNVSNAFFTMNATRPHCKYYESHLDSCNNPPATAHNLHLQLQKTFGELQASFRAKGAREKTGLLLSLLLFCSYTACCMALSIRCRQGGNVEENEEKIFFWGIPDDERVYTRTSKGTLFIALRAKVVGL